MRSITFPCLFVVVVVVIFRLKLLLLFRFFVGPVHFIFMLSFLNSLLLLFINNVMIFKKIKLCTCRRQVHFVLYGSFFARTNRKLVRSDVKKKTLSEYVFFAVRLRSDENDFFRKKIEMRDNENVIQDTRIVKRLTMRTYNCKQSQANECPQKLLYYCDVELFDLGSDLCC